ncbi:hypothetical protein ASE96_05075 [Arthrobacter sp. Leaf69]|nr:hypothetical protein ASE96_05075 [Arthrobacter sp. Leaf69]
MHRAGPAGTDVAGAADEDPGVAVPVAAAEAAGALAPGALLELAGEDSGVLDVWDCAVPAPHPARKSAAAAAAVVNASLVLNR